MARSRVVVYDTRIASLFDQDENAVAFTKDVIDDIIARAQREAPRGNAQSGNRIAGGVPLWKMHKSTGVLRRGPYGAGGSAYNDARHAGWVHNGTPAVIVPTTARYLSVPVPAGTRIARLRNTDMRAQSGQFRRASREQPSLSGGRILTPAVRGQAANPWLRRAGDASVAYYRARPYYRKWAKGGTRLTGGNLS